MALIKLKQMLIAKPGTTHCIHMYDNLLCNYFFFTAVELTHKVMLVSGVQHGDSTSLGLTPCSHKRGCHLHHHAPCDYNTVVHVPHAVIRTTF